MSFELERNGKSYFVIDNGHISSASVKAAGIINPITGKNFVLSWRFEEFLPVALETYATLEKFLGIQIVIDMPIIRSVDSIDQENLWLAKSSDSFFGKYLDGNGYEADWLSAFRKKLGYIPIKNSCRVDIKSLLYHWKTHLIETRRFLEEEFDYQEIKIKNGKVNYKHFSFDKVVFCEGAQAIDNPFFDSTSFSLNRGDVFTLKIQDIAMNRMYKDELFFIPYGDTTYWVGGGYLPKGKDEHEHKKEMENLIKEILIIDFEHLHHEYAWRPSTKNRRPLLRQSDTFAQLYQFNGLGTKGTSLAPYFSKVMSEFLFSGLNSPKIDG